MNKSQTSSKQSFFSLKLLGSCAVIAYSALTSTGYASTDLIITLPLGHTTTPSLTVNASRIADIQGQGSSAYSFEVTDSSAYATDAITHVTSATILVGHSGALGAAATNSVTLTSGVLQMASGSTIQLDNSIILASAGSSLDANNGHLTVAGQLTGSFPLALASTGGTRSTSTITVTPATSSTTFTSTLLVSNTNLVLDHKSIGAVDANSSGTCTGLVMSGGTRLSPSEAMKLPPITIS